MKKAIFIDRDGTIIAEPADEQVDSLEKLSFVPGAIGGLRALTGLGFELVMVTNQDGLGTPSFPEKDFLPPHEKMLQTLAGEGVVFDDILIDRSFPHENLPTRKPGTGMLGKYLDGSYDLGASFVIGDRETDLQLAAALGAKGILIGAKKGWAAAVEQIRSSERHATVVRKTRETDITLELDLDGKGASQVDSGVKFLDHMLDQLVHHGGISLQLRCKGDLEVDEHHSIEDIAICLGEALKQALGDKRGIERYGFSLPMDESRATVLLDFGGRAELVWDVNFTREYVGDMPTEMFKHFFKSLSVAAACNLCIEARGENNHHIAEAVFKAFARALKQAVRRDIFSYELPSSKGSL
ncbi:MAG: bifunctional histidinol-phosphatase/imidazoleglycerol-phosphate dehydratase HisB [Bacteroidales bacterium]|nr:bifunctional histidinol-phosphatase/imidazoleglycerol-phosphate dehydratase HisB [Bacteroidales bacterium]